MRKTFLLFAFRCFHSSLAGWLAFVSIPISTLAGMHIPGRRVPADDLLQAGTNTPLAPLPSPPPAPAGAHDMKHSIFIIVLALFENFLIVEILR